MNLTSALNIGAQGMQTGMSQLNRTASDIARLNTGEPAGANQQPAERAAVPSLESSMVGQIEAKHLVQSNARTVEVASDTLGTLLDVKA